MFSKDLNTGCYPYSELNCDTASYAQKSSSTNDVVSFEQGVWCSKSWTNAPFGDANIPAGNRIMCCQPGNYLNCSCPGASDADKESQKCCPTTAYSVKREGSSYIDGASRYNFRAHSDFLATPNDCVSCPPGQYTDDLNLQRTCTNCPHGWYQNEESRPFCLPCTPGMSNVRALFYFVATCSIFENVLQKNNVLSFTCNIQR